MFSKLFLLSDIYSYINLNNELYIEFQGNSNDVKLFEVKYSALKNFFSKNNKTTWPLLLIHSLLMASVFNDWHPNYRQQQKG